MGPRIIRYGFAGQDNVFGETDVSAATELGEWKPVGGHRLWHAPRKMSLWISRTSPLAWFGRTSKPKTGRMPTGEG